MKTFDVGEHVEVKTRVPGSNGYTWLPAVVMRLRPYGADTIEARLEDGTVTNQDRSYYRRPKKPPLRRPSKKPVRTRTTNVLSRSPSHAQQAHAPVPKTPPLRNDVYLVFVREKACCGCGAPPPSDAHHFGPRGAGQKTDDYRTIPLCRDCHDYFHAHGHLRGFDRAMTERQFYLDQVNLLVRWLSYR